MRILIVFLLLINCFVFCGDANKFSWDVFVKTYGNEKFIVNFPNDPVCLKFNLKDKNKKGLFIKASEGEIDYVLQVAENYNEDEKKVLFNILRGLKNFPFVNIVKFSFCEKKDEKFLDVIFQDLFLSIICKAKIIVTKNNIYSLFTSYKNGMDEKHKFFIKSFHLD
ncbi:MAG: hypothetical protein AMS24_00845 [Chlamydiae bacterium SM23_39]|nr:MAG: hypothetical protein AMS24_00845 [Chlamydiae bacterium SM23_39]